MDIRFNICFLLLLLLLMLLCLYINHSKDNHKSCRFFFILKSIVISINGPRRDKTCL